MSNRKVSVNFTLVGKSRPKESELSNTELYYLVESKITEQFGNRPVLIQNEEALTSELRRFPDYYAAGWFVSNSPITGTSGAGSELLVVAYGSSMISAQAMMMDAVSNSDWDSLAKNV